MAVHQYGTGMTDEEIAEFLEDSGLGTVAFGDASGGYAIPMSFGYDAVRDRCIFQFGLTDDSHKADYVDAGNIVSLAVHDWRTVDDRRSVVVRGTLHPIDPDDQARAAGIFAATAKIASLEVFHQPIEALDLRWYELHVDEKEGRKADAIADDDGE